MTNTEYVVAIGGGHGLYTAGKRTPDDEREWSFNNKVVLAAIERLKEYKDITVVRMDDPTGQIDVPLNERTNKANNAKADLLVSIHHNALTGKWADHTGTETYTYVGNQPGSTKLAKAVQPRLARAYGLKDRGIKQANFHMVRESNMPAILTEGGYMDSSIDIKALRDDNKLRDAGVAIADGIAEYFGISVLEDGAKPEPVESPKPVAEVKPVAKPSTSVAGAKLVKNENAYFLATEDIKVRSQPTTKATHTGTFPKGASLNYKRVFEGNGYRWLEYTGNSGNTLYIPYRRLSGDTRNWGTFHASRPQSKAEPSTVIKVGDKVTASRLYGSGADTTPDRTTPITGYVEKISNSWKNPYRLVKTKGKTDYLGFARKENLSK
ncbi:N-acetylmuramoyl-L-alanine amidase [Marinilactibacillus psychrotolerans]|uniref:N-acetylmuramoyl-L-alanine amidase n=1 Tax=Marinilactibacillus psychrotolerans TaxID=191770 RepID=UPI003888CC80